MLNIISRKVQIKAAMRYSFVPSRTAIIKRWTITSVDKDEWTRALSNVHGRKIK